jgi:hypothetical protein
MDYEIVFIVILVFILILIATIYIYNYFNSNQIANGGLIYDEKAYNYDELVSLQTSNTDYRTLILNDTYEDASSIFVNELNIYLQCPVGISDENYFWKTLPYIDASNSLPTSQPNNYGGNLTKPLKTMPPTQFGDDWVQILTLPPGHWVVLNNPYVGYPEKPGYRITALKNYKAVTGTICVDNQQLGRYGEGCPCGNNNPDGCGMPSLFESTIDGIMDLSIVDGCNYSLTIQASITKKDTDISSKTPYIFNTNPCKAIGKNENGCLNPVKDGFFKNTSPCIDNNDDKAIQYCVNGSPENSDYTTALCWNTPCTGTGDEQNNICNLCGSSSKWCQSIQNGKKFGVKPYCYSHGDDGSSSVFISPYISILSYSNLRDKGQGNISGVFDCPSDPQCGSPTGPPGPTGPIETCENLGLYPTQCSVNDYACYKSFDEVACNKDPAEFNKPGYNCNPLCYNGDGPTGTTGTTGGTCDPPQYQSVCNSQCAVGAHVCINGGDSAKWGCYDNRITCVNYPFVSCEQTCQQGNRP